MLKFLLTISVYVFGCLGGFFASEAAATTLSEVKCSPDGDASAGNSYSSYVCSLTASVSLGGLGEGGTENNCPPKQNCDIDYDFTGTWTAGVCISRVAVNVDDIEKSSYDIPSGNAGGTGRIDLSVPCSLYPYYVDLIFYSGTTEVMRISWTIRCITCPI